MQTEQSASRAIGLRGKEVVGMFVDRRTEALPGLSGSLPALPYGVLRVTERELRPNGLMGMPVGFSAASPRGSEPQCVGAPGSH